MSETQVIMAVSDLSGFFSRNHFQEGSFTFQWGGFVFQFRVLHFSARVGGMGVSVLMEGFRKNCRMGGEGGHSHVSTMGNPVYHLENVRKPLILLKTEGRINFWQASFHCSSFRRNNYSEKRFL